MLLFWICIISQYSGINASIWSNFNLPLWGSYGRICEMLPIAIVGVLFSKYGILDILKKHWLSVIIFSLMGLITIYSYIIYVEINGYAYSGFWRMTVALLIVVLFAVLPLDKMSIGKSKVIATFSIATPGVYYIQRLILTFIGKRLPLRYCSILFLVLISVSILVYRSGNKYLKYIFT